MKRIVSSFLLLAFLPISLFSQGVKKDVREVGGFKEIYIAKGMPVVLKQGEKPKVIIEGKESYLKEVVTSVSNSILKLDLKKVLAKNECPTVTVVFTEIVKLVMLGGGSLKSSNDLVLNKLSMGFNGASKVNLRLKVNTSLSAKIVKADVNIFGRAAVFSSNLTDGGNLSSDLDADKLRCTLEGGTMAKLAGTCGLLFANISGGGKLNAYDLQSDKVRISIFGDSEAKVMVLRELHTIADGNCKVYYKGEPRAVKSEKSGGAVVVKAK